VKDLVLSKIMESYTEICISEGAWNSEVAQRVREVASRYSGKESFLSPKKMTSSEKPNGAKSITEGKRRLVIEEFSGQFFKSCPGSTQKKSLPCCNYFVLNLGSQCPFDCSYCYLQTYLNRWDTVIYSNLDVALGQLLDHARKFPHLPFRVGTGEVIDSLALDPLTEYSKKLIETFRDFPNWTLELKTKSDRIQNLLEVQGSKNVLVGWSINPQEVIDSDEFGTASLSQRLDAAQAIVKHGYKVAFHIDPMIYFSHWEEAYSNLVDQVTSRFAPSEVSVISVGALRIQTAQKNLWRERFTNQIKSAHGELFPSEGNKMRYDHRLRTHMMETLIAKFRANDQGWKIFMCMETPEAWNQVFGNSPIKVGGLEEIFRPLPQPG
jgi:spore photoproduct lyase